MLTPVDVFSDVRREAEQACGARLFTVTVLDRDAGVSRRAFTSHPVDYPVSGTKPMRNDAWTRQVIDEGRSFVANTTAEFAPFFKDHALINSLGCAAAMNIPVSDGTKVIGTVNVLDVEGHFTSERIAALEAIVARRRETLAASMATVIAA